MKKADARYIVNFHKWINDNMDVKSDDLEYYANCMMNSENLLNDVVNGVDECANTALNLPIVSNSALIDYIENDAEIAMPINEFFNEDGTNITKKQYGKVLLKYLVKELRAHYC